MVSLLVLSAGVFSLFLAARVGRGSGVYALLYALIGAGLVLSAFPDILHDALPQALILVATFAFFAFR